MKRVSLCYIITIFSACFSRMYAQQTFHIDRLEPSFWWSGMEYNNIQLLVKGKGIAACDVKLDTKEIELLGIHKVTNPDYLFLDLEINTTAKPGFYPITFMNNKGERVKYDFELKARNNSGKRWQGFNSKDAIYLLMPDRFANGDAGNDNHPAMLEKADRTSPHGRHGGDIEGIIAHLDYIANLGFTAVWINPLLENNMPEYSYHGYGITDFYRVDPRYGSNNDYVNLVNEAHNKGLKIIMDMVLNHCGVNHWFVSESPDTNWLNLWNEPTWSNFRGEVNIDPYASAYDKTQMEKGWFASSLADLNLQNSRVLKYMIQNTIWWIEYAGIDGIRMDTYPYPNKKAMVEWAEIVQQCYPSLTIVGETWLQKTSHTAYWQAGTDNYDGYNSHIPVVTDFPLYYAIGQSMNENEGWTEGLRRLYYVLAEDFLYADPDNLLIFADNHDLERYFTTLKEDLSKYKLGLAFLLTTRGIPQVYYGTEILMTGDKRLDDGYIRTDFPGGWPYDSVDAFSARGLSEQQLEASEILKKLLEWRKNCPVIHNGNILQFIPENDIYVYYRYNDTQSVMVVLNKRNEDITLDMERYREGMPGYSAAKNILTGEKLSDLNTIIIPAMSPLVLEMIK